MFWAQKCYWSKGIKQKVLIGKQSKARKMLWYLKSESLCTAALLPVLLDWVTWFYWTSYSLWKRCFLAFYWKWQHLPIKVWIHPREGGIAASVSPAEQGEGFRDCTARQTERGVAERKTRKSTFFSCQVGLHSLCLASACWYGCAALTRYHPSESLCLHSC